MDIRVKNNDSILHTWGGKEFQPGEIYLIQNSDYTSFYTDANFFSDVASGVSSIGDLSNFYSSPIEGWQYFSKETPPKIITAGEVVLGWTQFYSLYQSVKTFTHTYYVDCGSYYFAWILLNGSEVYCPKIEKGTADATAFEANMKPSCNPNEAMRIRVTTCKIGRAIHQRYIGFTTAEQGNFDNTNYLEVDYGDVTYTMKKRTFSGGVYTWATTTNAAECNETWIDWEPTFDYEICSGYLDVGKTVAGNDWECHVIAVPDIPSAYGGSIELVSNPRLKWRAGFSVGIDASLNPKEMKYSASLHTNKIRVIIKHPAGANSEFQLCLQIFK